MSRARKHIFLVLRIAVVAVGTTWGVCWLSGGQRWSELKCAFSGMSLGPFVLALGVFTACQVIVALRWWLLLRSQRVFIGFWSAVRLNFLGLFYNNFLPGSVGGDLIRAWYVTKHTDKKFEAALSVFVDRAIGLLGTLMIAGFFHLLFMRGCDKVLPAAEPRCDGSLAGCLPGQQGWVFVGLAGVVLVVVGAILLVNVRVRRLLARGWFSIRTHGFSLLGRFRDAVVVYSGSYLTILLAFAMTVFLQVVTITGFWILGRDLGIDAPLRYYYVFFALTWVLGTVPVSIGGAVVVEVSLVALFVKVAGVSEGLASALALCQRVIWMLASVPGMIIHLVGAHLPKEFLIDSDEGLN